MASTSTPPRVLIYLLRRDLRVADNPILHELASRRAPFTHLLPLYVFPAQQVEVSGFLAPSGASAAPKSPFPEARSQVGRFWRCGPHRARFLAQSVWAVKEKLEGAGSGLLIRVGLLADVTEELMRGLKESGTDVAAVWMTSEEGVEERREERDVRSVVSAAGKQFKLWADEKYYIDELSASLARPRQPAVSPAAICRPVGMAALTLPPQS